MTIGGAFAYDNVFLMDGVDINDNVLGQPNNLFIEDAIQEQQVLTSGISAEYGRFSGGVVNVITKSGGNLFSGAFRSNFTNPAWSVETPLEKSAGTTRASKLSPTYEVTAGGPLVRDRVWFFGGTRLERTTTQGTFAQTRIPYTSHNDNTRYEGKVTGTHCQRSHGAGQRHRQPHRSRAAGLRRQHRSRGDDDAVDPEPALRGELARRARRAHLRDRAVLAEELEAAERRRHRAPASSSRRS